MRVNDGTEPISDDELLYRRVATVWYPPLNARVFAPHQKNDATGLSVSRAKYKSIEDAGRGQAGKSYYVAILRAGDLRTAQIAAVPRPISGDPGHAELPDLNSANRKDERTQELQRLLVQLTLRVEGPFEAVPPVA